MSSSKFHLHLHLIIIIIILTFSKFIYSVPSCAEVEHRVAVNNLARGSTIIIVNECGYNLTLVDAALDDGRWISTSDDNNAGANCDPHNFPTIPNNQTISFASVTSRVFGGAKGRASYIVDDGATPQSVLI